MGIDHDDSLWTSRFRLQPIPWGQIPTHGWNEKDSGHQAVALALGLAGGMKIVHLLKND